LPASGNSAAHFDLHSDLLAHHFSSQVVLVSVRTDWRMSTSPTNHSRLECFAFEPNRAYRSPDGNWWNGFGRIFRLGVRHIAEGTDHLPFLLVLLLPAPHWPTLVLADGSVRQTR
jgi:hypothetical protein